MLETLRKNSQHWIIKILFGLLILSFVVLFGTGDMLKLRFAGQSAITVGSAEIGPREVLERFRQQAQRLIAMSKGKFTMDQIRQLGVLDSTIDQMVSSALLEQEAAQLKLFVSDDTLRQMIYKEPAFQSNGKFDKMRYEQALNNAGLNEAMFLAEERTNILRDGLLNAVSGGVQAPASTVELMFRHAYEQRVAEIITFPADKMSDPGKPDDTVLKTFFDSHKNDFLAPEMRSGVAIVLRPEDYAGDIKPADADIEKAYKAREAEFVQPERRTVSTVSFADEAKAKAFVAAVKSGKDFAAEAKAEGSEAVDMGAVEPKTIPVPELAQPVFAAPSPGIVGPVQSGLGWQVAKISAIQGGKSKPLAEVRALIISDLVKNEAQTRLYPVSTALEDSLGSGAGLEEAATSKGLKLIKIGPVDAQGNGPDGKPAGTPVPAAVISALFQAAKGDSPNVEKLDGDAGYYAVRTDEVTAPAVPALDKIKDRVSAAWAMEERQRAARKLAEAAVERLNKGEALAAVAGAFHAETTAAFRRVAGQGSTVLVTLPSAMFPLKPGQAAVVDDPSGAAIAARLKTILPADPKEQAMAFLNARDEFAKSLDGDIMTSYRQALTKDLGVKVNRPLIDSQFEK